MPTENIDKQNITFESIEKPQINSKHFHLPRVFMIVIIVIVSAILFGSSGYLLGSSMTVKSIPNPCTSESCLSTPTPSPKCEQIPWVFNEDQIQRPPTHPHYCPMQDISEHPLFKFPHVVYAIIPQGKTVNVMAISNTSSLISNYLIWGFPTSYGPGIFWVQSNGPAPYKATVTISIHVDKTVPIGKYNGMGILLSPETSSQYVFPVLITVTKAS